MSLPSSKTPSFLTFPTTEELLVNVSQRVIQIIDDGDFTNPFLNCLAEDIVMDCEREIVVGKLPLLVHLAQHKQSFPNYHLGIQNCSAIVDEDTGRATVIMNLMVAGTQDDTRYQDTTVLVWMKINENWTCTGLDFIRRIQEFD